MIVVGGEALFDLVLDGTDRLAAHPGGGPFNTARALARLEQPVGYLGRLSADRFGTRLRRLLLEDGVSDATVVDTEDPTTLALAELNPEGGASYRFYADGTSAAGLTAEAALAALPADVDMLHVGTLGLVLEPTAIAMEAVVEHLHGSALIAVDPNVRPTITADPARYRARLQRILARTDVVKLSEEDAAWLHPELDPVDAARALLVPGPAAAVLTRGAAGAVAVTAGGETVAVPAPPVHVVDTIGAGDAFGGGLLAWWRRAGLGRAELADIDALTAATEFACLVAARTCERPGASPPRLSELEPRSVPPARPS
jgi:fructokinase